MNRCEQPRTLRGLAASSEFQGRSLRERIVAIRDEDSAADRIDPRLLKLPEGVASTGDPNDGNPFPEGSARHEKWQEATRIAERECAAINAEWLERHRSVKRPDSFEGLLQANEIYRHLDLALLKNKFNIWAWRASNVVWDDRDVAAYDLWLVGYANGTLEWWSDVMLKGGLPNHLVEQTLRDMRDILTGVVNRWKATAREQRDAAQRQATAAVRPFKVPATITQAVKKRMRALVVERREKDGQSAVAFARAVGMSTSAVVGIINEDRKKFAPSTRDRLLQHLGITLQDWYKRQR